jgi:hypothetical protein
MGWFRNVIPKVTSFAKNIILPGMAAGAKSLVNEWSNQKGSNMAFRSAIRHMTRPNVNMGGLKQVAQDYGRKLIDQGVSKGREFTNNMSSKVIDNVGNKAKRSLETMGRTMNAQDTKLPFLK